MNVIDAEPDQNSGNSETKKYAYKSLGIWRRIYLAINWFFAAAIVLSVSYVEMTKGLHPMGLGVILLASVIFLGYAYWLHDATVQRKTGQLLVIAILNVIPFLNPIAAILVFAIRSTSKSELAS